MLPVMVKPPSRTSRLLFAPMEIAVRPVITPESTTVPLPFVSLIA